LDRLTSGILIVAKNRALADSISEKIRSSSVQKEYLARVDGVFPEYVDLL
jgi:tRNA pseudouridine32 synthase